MRVTFSCSASYASSDQDMMESVLNFIISLDTSPQHDNTIIEEGENYIRARLFFVDTPIIFKIQEHRLSITVDSTMTGPGYHASMVNMVHYLAEVLEISWDEDSAHDVSGYWQHRDFKQLQEFMTKWLIDYSKNLTSDPNLQTPIRTNLVMPFAMLPSEDWYFACHMLGYIHKDFFIYIQKIEDPSLFSRAFFLWWNVELDAEFYLKCALSIIWCRLNWLPPVLESEMLDISNVLVELEVAWQMDKSLQLPIPEWIELAKLTEDKELVDELIRRFPTEINQPPSKGYRRYDIIYSLGDGMWRIKLPGKMHTVNDEDGSLVFWDHEGHNIRITIASRRDRAGALAPALDLLSRAMEGQNVTPHLLPGYINIPAFIVHSEAQEGGKEIFKTTLFAAVDGSIAIVSIYYANRNERQWALSICNSLNPGAENK